MRKARFRTSAGYVRSGEWDGDSIRSAGQNFDPNDVDILAPCEPTKILCIGLNYHEHIDETGKERPDRPMLFLKPPNTIASHGDTITFPHADKRFDYEAELGVVIDAQCRDVSREDAMQYVRGFTCINDLSNRDDQSLEQNWVRGKAFDSAAPIGPVVASPDQVPDDATIESRVNGETRQSSSREMMIFSIEELIEEITQYLTLEPGDVIATGTPEGIARLEDGDTVEIEVEGVGTLRHEVRYP